MTVLNYSRSGSQCNLGLMVPETLSGSVQSQNYFQNNAKLLFAFLTLIVLQAYNGVFQRLHDLSWQT